MIPLYPPLNAEALAVRSAPTAAAASAIAEGHWNKDLIGKTWFFTAFGKAHRWQWKCEADEVKGCWGTTYFPHEPSP